MIHEHLAACVALLVCSVSLIAILFGFGLGYRHANHKFGWWAGLRHGERKAREDLLRPQRRDPKGRYTK